MDLLSFQGLATPLQILLVDLLLGADNAVLIGLASRSLPQAERRRATALGVVGAVVLRLAMTLAATSLLAWPLIEFVGALLLAIIALNIAQGEADETAAFESVGESSARVWRAAVVIVVADAAMSLDNVVALAAIAKGNFLWLLIGVGLSLPMLGYAGLFVADALHRAPGTAVFGAALLGWIAGGMAISDPLWAKTLETNAPGLAALAPAMGAAFVFLHARWVPRPARPRVRPLRVAAERPRRTVAAAVARSPEPASTGQAEGRVMLVGMLILAAVAGGFIALVAYYGGLE